MEVLMKKSCDCCGAELLASDLNVVNADGKEVMYCQKCIRAYTYTCNDCGRRYTHDYYSAYVSGRIICDACLTDYYYCERCESYVCSGDYHCEYQICYNCLDEEEDTGVEDYHENGFCNFIGEAERSWRGKWRGIGVELEVDRDNRNNSLERKTINELYKICPNLKFEYDGSLNYGFEIITLPHTIKEFYKIKWQEILDVCKKNGYISHNAETCGLHIHFSRAMFGYNAELQENAIAKLVAFFEMNWDELVKVSRRKSYQLESYAARYDVAGKKAFKSIGKTQNLERYKAINNTNCETVEIRIMRGTLNLDSFLACVDFCTCIAKNSKKITWKQINQTHLWLKGLKKNTLEYLKSRNAFMEVVA